MKRAAHFFRMQPSCRRTIAEKLTITQDTQIKPVIGESYVTFRDSPLDAGIRVVLQGGERCWFKIHFLRAPLWVQTEII